MCWKFVRNQTVGALTVWQTIVSIVVAKHSLGDGSLSCDMNETFVDRLVQIERNAGPSPLT